MTPETFPWLTAMIVLPLLGAALLWLLPAGARRHARPVALAVSLLVLALGVGATLEFDVAQAADHQLAEQASWIPAFGVSYALGVDGVGLSLVLLSVFLVPLVVLAAWREHGETDAPALATGGSRVAGTSASGLDPEVVGDDGDGPAAPASGTGGGTATSTSTSTSTATATRARTATTTSSTGGGATAIARPGGTTTGGATAVATGGRLGSRVHHYLALVLVLEAFMVAVFSARDVFLFYVLFEAMLIPVYFMIGAFGGLQRRYAAVKFLLFSLVGGLVMLVGVIALYLQGPRGPEGFLTENLVGLDLPVTTERLLFLAFFLAFAIKAPMWPVHTWLPDTAEQAPAGTSTLLVGVLDKVGTFGMLTLCLPLFPEASRWAAPVIVVLALISILYGALLAIGQADLMRLIAYTSVSHFGFIVLGIFVFTQVSIEGASLYMVNHGLSTGALFLLGGFLVARRGTARIADYGGLQRVVPVLAGTFLVAGLSALSLPGLATFVSEFLVLVGTFQVNTAAGVVATLGVVLAALYVLLTYQRVFTGPVRADLATAPDLSAREKWVIGPILAALLVLGFYPAPVLDLVREPALATLFSIDMLPEGYAYAVNGDITEVGAGETADDGAADETSSTTEDGSDQ